MRLNNRLGPRGPNREGVLDALKNLFDDWAALRKHARTYVVATLDRKKVSVRRAAILGVVALPAFIFVSGLLLKAAENVVSAITVLFGETLDLPQWAAGLASSASILLILSLLVFAGTHFYTLSSRKKMLAKYSSKVEQLDHDISQVSTSSDGNGIPR